MGEVAEWTGKQLELMRRTVAKDCNSEEFDQFIHICKQTKLDPIRRQIYAFVFNKDRPDKRQMTVVTAIGGHRAIAERTGNYRPDERAPRYEMGTPDPNANPLGIIRCEVTVYKFSHGAWFPVVGEAWWDEYVPLYDGKIDKYKTGWTKMPRIMIAKCAEANALRRAWPDDFAGLLEETEIDRQMVDITPSEAANEAATEAKLELIGGRDAVIVDWCDGSPLQRIGISKFWDASLAWMNASERSATEIRIWCHRNHASRAEAKAKAGSHYLDWWREVEKRTNELERIEVDQGTASISERVAS